MVSGVIWNEPGHFQKTLSVNFYLVLTTCQALNKIETKTKTLSSRCILEVNIALIFLVEKHITK